VSDPISLGIIGLGAMGSEMLGVAVDQPDFHVAICAEVNPENLRRVGNTYPNIKFTFSPSEVINSEEIQAVYIATPPGFHADHAVAAMEQGKAVFCEKPLAATISDGEKMVEVAARSRVENALNLALADRRAVLEIERALKSGELGGVCGVEIRLAFPTWPREFQSGAAWLGSRQQGGFIREIFSHFAYLTDRLIGTPKPAFVHLGHSRANKDGSETSAFGLLHAGHIPISIIGHAQSAIPEMYEWYIYGTRCSYCLKDWGDLLISHGESWGKVTLDGERGSEKTRLTAFAKQIRGEQLDNRLPDFSVGLRVPRLVEAFHDSVLA
jgi:predicted dehydrogenase